jgi:hypothetical protein
MCSLPDYVTFKSFPGVPLQHIFIAAGDDLLELIQGLFLFNPCTRTTASQVLLLENLLSSITKTKFKWLKFLISFKYQEDRYIFCMYICVLS